MRIAMLTLLACVLSPGLALSGEAGTTDDIQQGHVLASELCSTCHLATPDQAAPPSMHPPAPPMATILKRKDITAQWLTNFLKTTHRGLDQPKGMPNLDLADFQIKQIVAYLMSVHHQ